MCVCFVCFVRACAFVCVCLYVCARARVFCVCVCVCFCLVSIIIIFKEKFCFYHTESVLCVIREKSRFDVLGKCMKYINAHCV
jgi:hypothetical protein